MPRLRHLHKKEKSLMFFFDVDSHSAPSCNRFGHNGKKTIILTFTAIFVTRIIIIRVTKIAVKVSCQFGKVPLAV